MFKSDQGGQCVSPGNRPPAKDQAGRKGTLGRNFIERLHRRRRLQCTARYGILDACTQRRGAASLEKLIVTHELEINKDGQATRPGSECHSTIGLTLTTSGADQFCQYWSTPEDDDDTTDSDYLVLERKWVGVGRPGAGSSGIASRRRRGRGGLPRNPSWLFCARPCGGQIPPK